jgi:hypothetical protein
MEYFLDYIILKVTDYIEIYLSIICISLRSLLLDILMSTFHVKWLLIPTIAVLPPLTCN